MKQNHWKIINSICWLMLALTLIISCTLAGAAEKKNEEADNGLTAEADTGVAEADHKKSPFDSFAWITVGIALGSFGAIAHLKFNGQKRKIAREHIENLSLQVAETSAVDWEITHRNEAADPMEGNINRLEADYEEKVTSLETKKKALIGETSKVAVEVLRIWG